MLMQEFESFTGYVPTNEEYKFIEDSYYESEQYATKEEFCKAWVADKASGRWDVELRLRKEMASLNIERERLIKQHYRLQEHLNILNARNHELENKLDKIHYILSK